ncbi:hypothetical protein BDK51DRAFT_38797 [Blyttiomyces helicus]|uniref:Uncharacterized protein n=1 Tax=Blyttiomyces helicus TaxID=388810 RepID=A0A4P9WA55_9FUNG|nr:hypothetical protein BDK51DRAFT_38797 [Blyttiomyces helicus]|eukprot:RKO87116.1 hypothetical protein BDK51DRAFT_38797 [Blyttiomyces helicus]
MGCASSTTKVEAETWASPRPANAKSDPGPSDKPPPPHGPSSDDSTQVLKVAVPTRDFDEAEQPDPVAEPIASSLSPSPAVVLPPPETATTPLLPASRPNLPTPIDPSQSAPSPPFSSPPQPAPSLTTTGSPSRPLPGYITSSMVSIPGAAQVEEVAPVLAAVPSDAFKAAAGAGDDEPDTRATGGSMTGRRPSRQLTDPAPAASESGEEGFFVRGAQPNRTLAPEGEKTIVSISSLDSLDLGDDEGEFHAAAGAVVRGGVVHRAGYDDGAAIEGARSAGGSEAEGLPGAIAGDDEAEEKEGSGVVAEEKEETPSFATQTKKHSKATLLMDSGDPFLDSSYIAENVDPL